MPVLLFVFAAWLFAMSLPAAPQLAPGDARRGEQFFREQRCITCHSIRGQGGQSAPDLGAPIGRDFTPAWMASVMWNHAPAMWTAMEQQGIPKPRLSEPQAADLFAYFHSVRFFERPGDAARGKEVFLSKRCTECHGAYTASSTGAPPVTVWGSFSDPIAMAQEMWNHAAGMRQVMARRRISWPRLTSQELTDLVVYVQSLPENRGRPGAFALASRPVEGEDLFKSRGCANCHTGSLSLERRLSNGTLTGFAVAMWNHAPLMWKYGDRTGQAPPRLDQDDMRRMISYLWYTRLYAEPGDSTRGRRVFVKKQCAACHNNPSSGAPDLKSVLASRNEPLRPFSIVAVLWQHGPAMLNRMRQSNIAWPRFSKSEMIDLIAYLNGPEFRRGEERPGTKERK